MGAYKTMYPLPSKTISAGGNVQVELLGLPLDARIAGFLFEITGTGTAASSTSAVTPVNLVQLLTEVNIDSDFLYVKASGRAIHVLDRLMNGYAVASSAISVTCDTNGVAVRGMCYLPLADYRAINPFDTAIPTRLLREKTINCTFKSALTLGLSPEVTVSSATLKITAICVPQSDDTVPTKTRIYYEDWAQATANLQPGHYTHLCIYDDSDLAVTMEQYAQLSMAFDGQQLIDRVPTEQLVALWNKQVPKAQDQELNYAATQSLQFIPVIFPGDKYKLTQVPFANGTVRVDIDSGTNTSARYLYRQALPITQAEGRAAAARLGYNPETTNVQVKTASKGDLKGSENRVQRHAKLLPKKLTP